MAVARRNAPIDVEILGWPKLNRAMRAVPAIAKRGLVSLVRDSANAIEDRAMQLVHIRRGDLARAIGQSGSGINRKVGIAKSDVPERGGSSSHRHPAVYAHFEEYGTDHSPAHPFMRPAADAEEPRFMARVNALADQLEREASQA